MGVIKNYSSFYKEIPISLKVLVARSSIDHFVLNLNTYNSIYIVSLGATGTELGMLTSISLFFKTLSAFLTGWISDRVNKKRMYLIGAFLGILVPVIFILVPTFLWLIPAFFMTGLADGLIQPSWTSMYANSISDEHRGTIYDIVNVFTQAPTLFAGIIGGWVISLGGGLTSEGIRPIYYIQAILLILAFLLVWIKLGEGTNEPTKVRLSFKDMLLDYRKVLSREGVRSWIGMKCLASLSVGL